MLLSIILERCSIKYCSTYFSTVLYNLYNIIMYYTSYYVALIYYNGFIVVYHQFYICDNPISNIYYRGSDVYFYENVLSLKML